jgi:hypothetical protein
MGIEFSYIKKLDELGLFREGGVSILDIGSSNLYGAKVEDIKSFVQKYAPLKGFLTKFVPPPLESIDRFASRLSDGSAYNSVTGGRNEAFAGELFEKAGMSYVSLDIADGYRTRILDLNRDALPSMLRASFDLVLNFGTTEHILNQLNCFKVIHEAVKVGGCIFHSLPAIGYVDHGYITYTGRCFFDIAGYNEYEIIACWFDGPGKANCIFDSLGSYSTYFPALKTALEHYAGTEQGRTLRELKIPDVGINVVYRKVKEKPFWCALESSTSVGTIPNAIVGAYQGRA